MTCTVNINDNQVLSCHAYCQISTQLWLTRRDANGAVWPHARLLQCLKRRKLSSSAAGNVFGRVCVCTRLSCSCSNFWKPWPRNFVCRCIFRILMLGSYTKVIGSRSRSQEENVIRAHTFTGGPLQFNHFKPTEIKWLHFKSFKAILVWPTILTPSTPAVPNCCCSKGSVPY